MGSQVPFGYILKELWLFEISKHHFPSNTKFILRTPRHFITLMQVFDNIYNIRKKMFFFQVQIMVNVVWVYGLKLCLNFGFDYINSPFCLVFVIDVTKRCSWKILPCFRLILELLHGLLSLEQRAGEWV